MKQVLNHLDHRMVDARRTALGSFQIQDTASPTQYKKFEYLTLAYVTLGAHETGSIFKTGYLV